MSFLQDWVLVKLQIYIVYYKCFEVSRAEIFQSICRWLLLGITSHNTAIVHFPWYYRKQYNIQHHHLIEDLLQKQSDIRALRKSCFEIFWKLTEALLQWNTFSILKFLVTTRVFLFLSVFLFWEAGYQRDTISKSNWKFCKTPRKTSMMEPIYDRANIESRQFATY